MLRTFLSCTERWLHRWMMFPWYFPHPQLALACIPQQAALVQQQNNQPTSSVFDNLSIWFAVPKRKTSHSKKRLRTIYHKRIKIKNNIITDPRTGEITLMHRLPYNWKDYLPSMEGKEELKKPYQKLLDWIFGSLANCQPIHCLFKETVWLPTFGTLYKYIIIIIRKTECFFEKAILITPVRSTPGAANSN